MTKMKYALIVFTIINWNTCIAQVQSNCVQYPDDYVPKNLNDALTYLNCVWSSKSKEGFKTSEEDDAVTELHFGSGLAIRNTWGFWQKKKNSLVRFFNRHDIYHPDDMSSIILTSFHRKLNGSDIDLDGQVKLYKDYWEKVRIESREIEGKQNKESAKEFDIYEIGDSVRIESKVSVQGKTVWVYTLQKYPDLNEEPECFIRGVVKAKRKKAKKYGNYALSILVTDICGCKKAIFSGLKEEFKVGEIYSFFSLLHYKISKE